MKSKLLSAVMVCALSFVACGGDDDTTPTPSVPKFDTADNIRNYLEGKTLLMEGANIPSHPSGYDENLDFGRVHAVLRQGGDGRERWQLPVTSTPRHPARRAQTYQGGHVRQCRGPAPRRASPTPLSSSTR